MDLANYNFTKLQHKEALVMENKILYFGESYREPGTFVVERDGESEQLKIIRNDKGFDLSRSFYNTASRVIRKEIYAFEDGNY